MTKLIVPAGTNLAYKPTLQDTTTHIHGAGGGLNLNMRSVFASRLVVTGYFSKLELGAQACWHLDLSKMKAGHVWQSNTFTQHEFNNGLVLPEPPEFSVDAKGNRIAYKKLQYNVIIKLLVPPKEAIICGKAEFFTYKQRTGRAFVAEVVDPGLKIRPMHEPLRSRYRNSFIYHVGQYIETELDADPYKTCAPGIHIFHSLELARN